MIVVLFHLDLPIGDLTPFWRNRQKSLRHTTAMMSIDELGLNLDKVQQTLRHSDPKVTMIYAKTGSRISSGVEEHLGDLFSLDYLLKEYGLMQKIYK